MARIPYTYRRGAIYYWRRRIPGLQQPITLSLGTPDPRLARTLSLILASASATICTANGFAAMNQDQAQAFLRETFLTHRDRIAMIERVRVDSGEDWEEERRATRAAAIAFSLLADRGRGARLTPEEAAELARGGDGHALLKQVEASLETFRALHWSDNAAQKLKRQLVNMLGDSVSFADIDEARRLKLKAFAMASSAIAASEVPDSLDLRALTADAAVLQNAIDAASLQQPSDAPTSTTAAPTLPPVAPVAKAEIVVEHIGSPNILDLVERLIADREPEDRLTPKTERQLRQSIGLCCEITGRVRIEDVTQADVSIFFDTMRSLPTNYRKSPRDKHLPISFFVKAAESIPADQVGLARGTVNRNLDNLSRVIELARARGHKVPADLDPGALRIKRKKRARSDRPPFTFEDLQRLFAHPIWSGCKGIARRNLPGTTVIKDGLYWVPLVLARTGARLEEIAGLRTVEAVTDHPIPHLQVRPNENRRLKNDQSARDVPLHPDLIALGFLDYVKVMRRKGEANLFPDLTPNRQVVGATFGGKLDFPFRSAATTALGEDRFRDGKAKTIHSFRHYVIGVLQTCKDVPHRVADDIVGHESSGEGGKRYGADADLALKADAIRRLPSIIALPDAAKSE